MRCSLTPLAVALSLFVSATASVAQSTDASAGGRLTIELNKLEPAEGGACRAFFLFRNQTATSLEGFEMSLAILNRDGVIDRLLTVDAAPLPVSRTTLKLFEIPETACDSVSQILVHDFASCKPQNGAETDCFSMIELKSRASAQLVD